MSRVRAANICLNLLSSLSHLELLQYDVLKGQFQRVDSEDVMFDPATRDFLEGPERFKTAVRRLYERNKISNKTPVTLVLPSFFTREYTVPETVLGEDLKAILTSEAERYYVFKKIDPIIGYSNIKDSKVLYTAYPSEPLTQMKQTFSELKIPLISIDCSYTATIRGLVAMGVVSEEINSQTKWGIIVISDYNVFLAVVEGGIIEKTLETPLPLQNIEEQALVNEIKGDFKEFFGFEILSRMVIVNNSYKIFSPTLVDILEFQGPTDVFDQNDRTLASRNAPDGPFPCSLEAVGGALVRILPQVPALELHEQSDIETFVDEDKQNLIAFSLIGLGVLLFGLQFGVGFLFDYLTTTETQKSSQTQAEINATLSSLAIVPEVKRKLYVKNSLFQNYKINNLMIKMQQALPPDAWLSTVQIKTGSDLKTTELYVKGGALTPDPLNTFVKELNKEVGEPALVPNVTPKQSDSQQRYFEYVLSNSSSLSGGAQ